MSAAGKRHLARIHTLHCVVCLNVAGEGRSADEAHHIEFVRGDHSDFATIPLCRACHEELHRLHRKPYYLRHRVDDVKLLAWTIQQLEQRR